VSRFKGKVLREDIISLYKCSLNMEYILVAENIVAEVVKENTTLSVLSFC